MIEVKLMGYCNFFVTVSDKHSKSEHIVRLTDVYYNHLTRGKISKEELIKRSFEFLLKKEPNDSTLPKFDLKNIKKKFPDYEDIVRISYNS